MFVYNYLIKRTNFLKQGGNNIKLKIVNIKKFRRTVILIYIGILFICLIGTTNTYSKGERKYKEEYIYSGDTLWAIAEKEAKSNKYYENQDVRNIISEIKEINHLENENLTIGQKILIPTY